MPLLAHAELGKSQLLGCAMVRYFVSFALVCYALSIAHFICDERLRCQL